MEDGDGNIVHGQWREESAPQGLEPIRRLGGGGGQSSPITVATVRDTFRDFFCPPVGEVSWQYRHARHTN